MPEAKFPLVSVYTLIYNTGRFVLESLECVRKQNYPNIEHIIIDDFSTDDSVQIIEAWINKNNYSCKFIKHTLNMGVQKGFQEVFENISGKYFVGISDDLWADNKIQDQVDLFEKLDSSYAMVYGDSNMIDKEGLVLIPSMFSHYRGTSFIPPSGDIFREVVKDFYFFIQAAMIRLEHFKEMNYSFDPNVISEDWDWELRLSRNYNILGVKEIFASYRWLETSIGRTMWTPEKIHTVWLSQARMLLKYYNHPKNTKEDNEEVFIRVKQLYYDIQFNSMASTKQKTSLLLEIFTSTLRFKWYGGVIKTRLLKTRK